MGPQDNIVDDFIYCDEELELLDEQQVIIQEGEAAPSLQEQQLELLSEDSRLYSMMQENNRMTQEALLRLERLERRSERINRKEKREERGQPVRER